jgi:glyoxylase-like metal-dependent hydrolase (beta-lactamase superfamily II)
MKQQAKGQIHERIIAIPNAWYPAYIIRGSKKSMMIDAGVNLLGPRYLTDIKDIFGDTGLLDYLFLTHSHYDHIGSAYFLKRHIPGLKIGAHERVVSLLKKQSVLEMMNLLSANHVELLKYNTTGVDLTLHPFEIDILLKQGDEFDLGGLTCQVFEVPGHTRDSLAFYIPEIKALFPGEAAGVLPGETGNEIQVEFLSSYSEYINSLEFMISLQPEIVCLGHGLVLTHKDASDFLDSALAETFRYRKLIENYLSAAGGNVERAIQEMAYSQYDVMGGILLERVSYMTNLSAQEKHIAELRDN